MFILSSIFCTKLNNLVSFFLHVAVQVFQHYLLKRLSFLQAMPIAPLLQMYCSYLRGLFPGSNTFISVSVWMTYLVNISGVLRSSAIIVLLSICFFSSFNNCFMYFWCTCIGCVNDDSQILMDCYLDHYIGKSVSLITLLRAESITYHI